MNRPIKEVWFLTSELESERASSFRQERWCRIFLDAGAALRIFNLRGAFDHSDAVCTDIESLSEFRRAGVAMYRGPITSVREGMLVRIARMIKHLFLVDLYLPNVFKLYRRLNFLLKNRQEPVVLMASSPPFSVAVVGAFIKKRHPQKVVFTVDMRDAWALHTALGGIKPVKRFIERWVLNIADSVTTVSHGLADEFYERYGVKVGVMYNIATHYLNAPPPDLIDMKDVCAEIDPCKTTLVYTGSTPENFYDVASIVRAFKNLKRVTPHLADRLQFVFVGACEPVQREAVGNSVSASDMVFVPHLPQSVARSLQASASALIFLAYHGPKNMGVVSTKLFEYLCLGQPIAPFDLWEDSDVDILLRRYCGRSINVHDEQDITRLLAKIAEDGVGVLPKLTEVNRVHELVDDYHIHAQNLLKA
ncbi:MAG: glycosyltransferase [Burkholderiales bacterium]|nr:glycosyltransferase [Burkholderiales bacterium]